MLNDSALCQNKKCRKKINCERYMTKPKGKWVSYIQVQDYKNCTLYRPIDSTYDFSKKRKK